MAEAPKIFKQVGQALKQKGKEAEQVLKKVEGEAQVVVKAGSRPVVGAKPGARASAARPGAQPGAKSGQAVARPGANKKTGWVKLDYPYRFS